jgi:hypothetical protein
MPLLVGVCDGCLRVAADPAQDLDDIQKNGGISCCPDRRIVMMPIHFGRELNGFTNEYFENEFQKWLHADAYFLYATSGQVSLARTGFIYGMRAAFGLPLNNLLGNGGS